MTLASPPQPAEPNGSDCVFGNLTWKRLEDVLTSHAKGVDQRMGVRHLLAYARNNADDWTEAALCIEIVSILAIALERRTSTPNAPAICGARCADFGPGVLSMT